MNRSEMRALWRPGLLSGLCLTAGVVLLPIMLTDLDLNQLTRRLVLVLAISGVALLTGRGGLVSLGHGVFVGVGAFATASLAKLGVPLVVAASAAVVIAGIFGVLLGLPALRVRGPHLALITLGLALAFGPLSKQFPSMTGGSSGIHFDTSAFSAPQAFGGSGADAEWRYAVSVLVIAAWFILARNLGASRAGRAIQAINDNDIAAAAFGVSPVWARTGTLGISAAMAGTGGALYALSSSYILHTQFDALLSFRLYAAAMLGGVEALAGPLYGVLFLVVIPEIADRIPVFGNQDFVFGLSVILVTLLAPGGAASVVARLGNAWRSHWVD